MQTPFLIDTHAHLHFPSFAEDVDLVLARMKEKNIWSVTIGTALSNSEAGIEFAEAHEGIWSTVGLHPSHMTSEYVDENEGEVHEHAFDSERAEKLAKSSKKVVAIGECGLDFYRLDQLTDAEAAKQKQEQEFLKQMQLAKKLDLPLVIHCRDGLVRLAEMIQDCWTQGWKPRLVVHSFTGTWIEAKPLIDLECFIAVNGISTFPLRKGQDPEMAIDRTIERIPIESLLLETDSPYLAPIPYRGKRNEPSYVEQVAEHVAQVRGISLDDIARQTTENAIKLFGLLGA